MTVDDAVGRVRLTVMTDAGALRLGQTAADLYAGLGTLRMVLLTGSAARGLSDAASDIDVYLYWDGIDRDRLEAASALAAAGGSRIFAVPTPSGVFEKYRRAGRFVDVESVEIAALERTTAALEAGTRLSGEVVKVAAGLRDAVAVIGADELAGWRRRMVFSDATALAEVAARSPRLLSPAALFDLTYARGDVLSFAARVSHVLLDAVALLGAANREFIPVDDPKWLPWHLGRLDHVPPAAAERIAQGLRSPTPAALDDLDVLLVEVLDIVDAHVPGADTRLARFAIGLRPSS